MLHFVHSNRHGFSPSNGVPFAQVAPSHGTQIPPQPMGNIFQLRPMFYKPSSVFLSAYNDNINKNNKMNDDELEDTMEEVFEDESKSSRSSNISQSSDSLRTQDDSKTNKLNNDTELFSDVENCNSDVTSTNNVTATTAATATTAEMDISISTEMTNGKNINYCEKSDSSSPLPPSNNNNSNNSNQLDNSESNTDFNPDDLSYAPPFPSHNTTTDSDNPTKQWACDICANIGFDNEALLDAHMQGRHPGVTSQYKELRDLAEEKIRPMWQDVLSTQTERWEKWGAKAFQVAAQRDGGPEKIAEAHAARAQLEVLVQRWIPDAKVFVFGSSVVMGVWDGLSDIDYMVVNVDDMERGIWPPNEKNAVRALTELLKRAGFKYINLEPVQHARVPIIKHHAAVPLFNTVSPEAEDVISRSARWTFTQPLSTQDRIRFEAGLREALAEYAKQSQRLIRNGMLQIIGGKSAEKRGVQSGTTGDHDSSRPLEETGVGGNKSPDEKAYEQLLKSRDATAAAAVEENFECYLNPILQLWWHSEFTSCSATFASTTIAVKAICHSPCITPNLLRRVGPLHDDFQPELFKIDFDMGFRPFGVRNSFLLRNYLNSHPCARPGAVVLKDWSKTSGVNNSIGGYYTSYAVNIMWIYYLVQRGVIPHIDPQSIPKSLVGCTDYNPQYVPIVPPETETDSVKRASMYREMGQLLVGFFAFYTFQFDWNNHVVSLNRNSFESPTLKSDLQWFDMAVVQGKKSTRYLQCIEDPYEENLNLGRHIGDGRRWKVLQELYRGLVSLVKDPFDRSCVFSLTADQHLTQGSSTQVTSIDGSDGDAAQPIQPSTEDILLLTGLSVKCVEGSQEGYVSDKELQNFIYSYRDALDDTIEKVMVDAGTMSTEERDKRIAESHGRARGALDRALAKYRWVELVRKVGYKQIGGRVYARRMIGARAAKPPTPTPSTEGSVDADTSSHISTASGTDLSDQLMYSSTASVLGKPLKPPPEWVLWTPPTYTNLQQTPIGGSTTPHHFPGHRESCSAHLGELSAAGYIGKRREVSMPPMCASSARVAVYGQRVSEQHNLCGIGVQYRCYRYTVSSPSAVSMSTFIHKGEQIHGLLANTRLNRYSVAVWTFGFKRLFF